MVYCNQGTTSAWKAEDYAICLDYAILGQIILASNCSDLDNYNLKDNEVIIYVPWYNTETGHLREIKRWLGFLMVRGDPDEVFCPYGYDEERSKILYSSFKHPLPNIFQGTAFKKHVLSWLKKNKLKINQNISFSYLQLLIGNKKWIFW